MAQQKMSSTPGLEDIPIKYRSIFSPIKQLNHVQSTIFGDVFKSNLDIVLSAPTGCGKTLEFQLAITELLNRIEQTGGDIKDTKIVYVAPTKALCNEIYHSWQQKFKIFDLKVALVTAESDPIEIVDFKDLTSINIIIATPEKFDAVTRNWKEFRDIASAVRLVLVDEVHLIGDKDRGATLEAIISRVKTFPNNGFGDGHIRFVLASAMLSNVNDVGRWISSGKPPNTVRKFKFDDNMRPVKLQIKVNGYGFPGQNPFSFSNTLINELPKVVHEALGQPPFNKQILIFFHTRKDLMKSLNELQKQSFPIQINTAQLQEISESITDNQLKSAIQRGFGFHHAGLLCSDRNVLEKAYRDGFVKILLSTSTLAMGVNLPAEAVIILSTEQPMNQQEISGTTLLQMIGRAGRQQYNTTGHVYIMTRKGKEEHYKNLSVGSARIESHLEEKLVNFLNAEIVLETITDFDASAMQWLRTTFLHASISQSTTEQLADATLKGIGHQAIQKLKDSGIIQSQSDGKISPLPAGQIMAKYFLSIDTMTEFQKFHGNETAPDILNEITKYVEFSDIYLRKDEKRFLNSINQRLKYPIFGQIKSNKEKVFILLQAYMGYVPIANTSLSMEAEKIAQTAERIVNGLIEYFISKTEYFYTVAVSSTLLAKSLRMRDWKYHFYDGLNICMGDANSLIRAGIKTYYDLMQANPRDIEDILGKAIPFGSELIAEAEKKFPNFTLNITFEEGNIFIRVVQANSKYDRKRIADARVILCVGDSNNHLMLYEDIQPNINEFGIYEASLRCSSPVQFVFAHLIHCNLAGADQSLQFTEFSNTEPILGKIPNNFDSELNHSGHDFSSPHENEVQNDDIIPPTIRQKPANQSLLCNMSRSSNRPGKTYEIRKKIRPSKTAKPRSISKGQVSSNQSTLSQVWKSKKGGKPQISTSKQNNTRTMDNEYKSVFDVKRKIEQPKTFLYSPDLFSQEPQTQTQGERQKARLYDFGSKDISQVSDELSLTAQAEKAFEALDTNVNSNESQALETTQIQSKIDESRKALSSSEDFVSINMIRSVATIPRDSINRNKTNSIDKTTKDENLAEIESLSKDHFDEDDFDLLSIPMDSIQNSLKVTTTCTNKKKQKNSVLDSLNLGARLHQFAPIQNDFEDSYNQSDQLKTATAVDSDLESEFLKRESFFSVGIKSPINPPEPTAAREDPQLMTPGPIRQNLQHSQTSFDSNKSVRDFPVQNKSFHSLDRFNFAPPPQLQHRTNVQNADLPPTNLQRAALERKRTAPNIIDQLMANADDQKRRKNKEDDKSQRPAFSRAPQIPQRRKSKFERASSKNVIARVSRSNVRQEFNTDKILEMCNERLRTDPTYTQKQYEIDYIRFKIMRVQPVNQSKAAEFAYNDDDEDDDFSYAASCFANGNESLFNLSPSTNPSQFFSK